MYLRNVWAYVPDAGEVVAEEWVNQVTRLSEELRKTWDEFYEWEQEYCEAKLATPMDERQKRTRVIAATTITSE